MAAISEAPVMEMRQAADQGWRGAKPVKKVNRRRMICPQRSETAATGAGGYGAGQSPVKVAPALSSSASPVPRLWDLTSDMPGPLSDAAAKAPLQVTVKLLYFSHDGQPADAGDAHVFDVTYGTTVEAVLGMARSAAGVEGKGRLMFRMKPLMDVKMTMDAAGVTADPKALHLMLSRKHRPVAVAQAAAEEAQKLEHAMALARAEAAARPPRRRRGDDFDEADVSVVGTP
eukprot:TRINITY_DN31132_c0_g1_i1.p1 TRINITY_DN31132_c0_g1~~TRINITY_DN31132_c0_g1_i1.p1  ORF type:complete len:258 (+),score=42.20 TRINITY_DN31132_c0_g1_i1:86-775(+)